MRPWDKQPSKVYGPVESLIDVIKQITATPVVPNERIAKVKEDPFTTYLPLVLDVPVFSDPTLNAGLFESTFSLDVFAKQTSQASKICGDLRVYLLDPYTRQLLRRDAHIVMREVSSMQMRSVTNLPITGMYHVGFDLTFQYYRDFTSPIDTISGVTGISINPTKEEQ